MCLHCVGDFEDLFEVLPGYWISRAKSTSPEDKIEAGNLALWKNGGNDPLYLFSAVEPFEEPFASLTEAEIVCASSKLECREDDWLAAVQNFQINFRIEPVDGYRLVETALQAGYDADKHPGPGFAFWFFNRIGKMLN